MLPLHQVNSVSIHASHCLIVLLDLNDIFAGHIQKQLAINLTLLDIFFSFDFNEGPEFLLKVDNVTPGTILSLGDGILRKALHSCHSI